MVDIGKRIKSARQKAGMSQEELAQAIGSTKSAVSRYEAGKRQPRYDQLLNIADALGVSVHALVDWGDVDEEAFKELFIYGEGPTQPEVIEHKEPIGKAEVEVHKITAEELEALMAKLQDGKPRLLSPDDLAELKATPKEQIAAALEKQEKQGKIKQVKAPVFKMDATVPPGRVSRFNRKFPVSDDVKSPDIHTRYEHSLGVTGIASSLLEHLNAPQARIAAALSKLNEEGQEKAAERVEELAEIPRYQSQEPPEDYIQSITLICPICGQHLRGSTETGKAYCNYCKRSFPLPQILK